MLFTVLCYLQAGWLGIIPRVVAGWLQRLSPSFGAWIPMELSSAGHKLFSVRPTTCHHQRAAN